MRSEAKVFTSKDMELEAKVFTKKAKKLSQEEFINEHSELISRIYCLGIFKQAEIFLSKEILKIVWKKDKYYGFLLIPNAPYSMIDGKKVYD